MKFSPDIGHTILWFWLALLKVLILSFGSGFILYRSVTVFHDGWKTKNRLKIWVSLSMACFALHVLLIGIK